LQWFDAYRMLNGQQIRDLTILASADMAGAYVFEQAEH